MEHTFLIPFVTDSINKIIVTYKQNDHVILERIVTSAMLVDGDALIPIDNPARTKFRVQLTQQESLLFEDKRDFWIQLNVFTNGRTRHASCEIKGSNGVQHVREVI